YLQGKTTAPDRNQRRTSTYGRPFFNVSKQLLSDGAIYSYDMSQDFRDMFLKLSHTQGKPRQSGCVCCVPMPPCWISPRCAICTLMKNKPCFPFVCHPRRRLFGLRRT